MNSRTLTPALRVVILSAVALASGPAYSQEKSDSKDPPKLTLKKKATLSEWVVILENTFAVQFEIDEDAENKEVEVSVRDAGYFEALDALCRAHGNITYFRELEQGSSGGNRPPHLKAAAWKEYPVQYSGHFKVLLTGMRKIRASSPRGASAWTEVELCVAGPPWHDLDFSAGTQFKWGILESRDSEGKDLTYREDASRAFMLDSRFSLRISGNSKSRNFQFEDFDLDKGLKLLAGKVAITVADAKIVRIPLKAGAPTVIPGGTLKFESMQEKEKDESGAEWRIAFTFKPDKGDPDLNSVLQREVRYEGHERWHYDNMRGGWTFEIETNRVLKAPTWVEFKARTGERTIDLPFRFNDVIFRGK
jgi:hypothetical protein